MQIKRLSLRAFAIYICDCLIKKNIDVVLSGGACVSIYTKNKYRSYDLDFVLMSIEEQPNVKRLLLSMGFWREGRYFKHKDTKYYLDFAEPPLSVGQEPVKEISKIKQGNRILRLLSPTDCVKDRLAAYYHWNDKQALNQAVWVATDNKVSFREIKRWSINEDMRHKFADFLKAYKLYKKY